MNGLPGAPDEVHDVVGQHVGHVSVLRTRSPSTLSFGSIGSPCPSSRPSASIPAAACRRCPCATCRRSRSGSRPPTADRERGSRWLAGSRAVLSMMPFVWTYWPVRSAARLGEHSGVVAKAFRNRAPSRASRSMAGVWTNGWPATRSRPSAESSTRTKTTFGRGVWVRSGGALQEARQRTTARRRWGPIRNQG